MKLLARIKADRVKLEAKSPVKDLAGVTLAHYLEHDLVKHLGLPPNTIEYSVEVSAGEPAIVSCKYYAPGKDQIKEQSYVVSKPAHALPSAVEQLKAHGASFYGGSFGMKTPPPKKTVELDYTSNPYELAQALGATPEQLDNLVGAQTEAVSPPPIQYNLPKKKKLPPGAIDQIFSSMVDDMTQATPPSKASQMSTVKVKKAVSYAKNPYGQMSSAEANEALLQQVVDDLAAQALKDTKPAVPGLQEALADQLAVKLVSDIDDLIVNGPKPDSAPGPPPVEVQYQPPTDPSQLLMLDLEGKAAVDKQLSLPPAAKVLHTVTFPAPDPPLKVTHTYGPDSVKVKIESAQAADKFMLNNGTFKLE